MLFFLTHFKLQILIRVDDSSQRKIKDQLWTGVEVSQFVKSCQYNYCILKSSDRTFIEYTN